MKKLIRCPGIQDKASKVTTSPLKKQSMNTVFISQRDSNNSEYEYTITFWEVWVIVTKLGSGFHNISLGC